MKEANQVTCCGAYGPDTTKDAMNYELGRTQLENQRTVSVSNRGAEANREDTSGEPAYLVQSVYRPVFTRGTAENHENMPGERVKCECTVLC